MRLYCLDSDKEEALLKACQESESTSEPSVSLPQTDSDTTDGSNWPLSDSDTDPASLSDSENLKKILKFLEPHLHVTVNGYFGYCDSDAVAVESFLKDYVTHQGLYAWLDSGDGPRILSGAYGNNGKESGSNIGNSNHYAFQVVSSSFTRSVSGNERSIILEIFGHFLGIECNRCPEIAEEIDHRDIEQVVSKATLIGKDPCQGCGD